MDMGHVLQMVMKICRKKQKPELWLRESMQKPPADSNPITALFKNRDTFLGHPHPQGYFSPEASSQAAAYFFTLLKTGGFT